MTKLKFNEKVANRKTIDPEAKHAMLFRRRRARRAEVEMRRQAELRLELREAYLMILDM
ncbi:MAG: hypothetical protein PHE27_09255 [Alphaproteobacteria bacterium]|nr:hypothetical protein [Alphaproteobacteria bacterium]